MKISESLKSIANEALLDPDLLKEDKLEIKKALREDDEDIMVSLLMAISLDVIRYTTIQNQLCKKHNKDG